MVIPGSLSIVARTQEVDDEHTFLAAVPDFVGHGSRICALPCVAADRWNDKQPVCCSLSTP
jgi:hypothetical protein